MAQDVIAMFETKMVTVQFESDIHIEPGTTNINHVEFFTDIASFQFSSGAPLTHFQVKICGVISFRVSVF